MPASGRTWARRTAVSDEHEERRRLAERALVVRAQAGDRAAFHDLVELYQRRLTYSGISQMDQ